MTPSDDLQRLVERIEGLVKSDAAVNDDIARALGWTQHSDEADPVYTRKPQLWWAKPGEEWSTMTVVPNYTGSVDAALTLVPAGWRRWLLDADNGDGLCQLEHLASDIEAHARGKTLALAITAASFRARITQEQSNGYYTRRKIEEAAIAKWDSCPRFDDWDHRDKMRPMPIGAASKPRTAREQELIDALKRTRAALVLLQPALNVMARECLADIIAREIEPAITERNSNDPGSNG